MEQGILAFATLLIGLTCGRQPVELMAAPPVAEVRLLLDGREVAALSQPPWVASVDFGAAAPHRLEAVGRDRAGTEVARSLQWVNLPRSETDLDIVVERDEAGITSAVRLAWTSARPAAPVAVRATLDGRPLPAAGVAGSIPLPSDAAGEGAHFLRVEVEFPGGRTAAREIAYGGGAAEASTTALTAVACELADPRREPEPGSVRVRLAGGGALRLAAIEKGRARVVLVLDPAAVAPLQRAAETGEWRRRTFAISQAPSWGDLQSSCSWLSKPLKNGDDEVMVLDPAPASLARDGASSFLFQARARAATRARDAIGVLLRSDLERFAGGRLALTNAVASAGLLAAGEGRRRSVVLLLGDNDPASGDLGIAGARGFLAELDVPLQVWSPVAAVAARADTGWGRIVDVSTCKRLGAAATALADALDRQRVVWVDGQHLPREVEVVTSALARAR
jgi:hypothetical protein